jgi:peroxiredoxin
MHSTVGETVRLADYQGKKTVLLFFFLAAFTGV